MCNIFDIQRSSFVDGPGIRTVLFFKGCNLRCQWCHNPESWSAQPQHAWYENRCVHCGRCIQVCPHQAINDRYRVDMSKCMACGQCVKECPTASRKLYGQQMTADELMPILLADREFFAVSGGGVTFSGGECLLQSEAVLDLLKQCKQAAIHTAVDTAGNVPWEIIEAALPWTDVFLYDLKCFSHSLHHELTGVSNERILDNYRHLQEIAPEKLLVRIPVIPDANSAEMEQLAKFLAQFPPKSVELLPYHKLGLPKADALGEKEICFSEPSIQQMEQIRKAFTDRGVLICS